MTGNTHSMTLERFRHLAEAYGGALERWPEAERDAARALAHDLPEAPLILQREAELDALVATLPPPAPVSSAVLGRVLDAAPHRQPDLLERLAEWLQLPGPRWLAPATLSLAILAGGIAGGLTGGVTGLTSDTDTLVAEDTLETILALGPNEEDLGS